VRAASRSLGTLAPEPCRKQQHRPSHHQHIVRTGHEWPKGQAILSTAPTATPAAMHVDTPERVRSRGPAGYEHQPVQPLRTTQQKIVTILLHLYCSFAKI